MLVGSGVIPARFEAFKQAIYNLIMQQFFTADNIHRFFSMQHEHGEAALIDLQPIVDKVNMDKLFDGLLDVIMASSWGSMLGMLGGRKALEGQRESFCLKMRELLVDMVHDPQVKAALDDELEKRFSGASLQETVGNLVQGRLAELTPGMVKGIVQNLIRQHLGWLVVWGGVFGALFGLIAYFIPQHFVF